MSRIDKKEILKDLKIGKAKLEQEIGQKGLEHIIFHKEESQTIE